MAAFPVPKCLAETAPREGGVRGWIVTLLGDRGDLARRHGRRHRQRRPSLARADAGLAIGVGAAFRHQPWKGKGLLPGDSSAAGDIRRDMRGAAVGNGAAAGHRRMEGVRRVDGDPA
jgi:hypothetical protein